MKLFAYLTIILSTIHTSCHTLKEKYLRKKYGIQNPKIETSISLNQFLFETIKDTSNSYCLSDTVFIQHTKELYKQHLKGQRYPQIRCFDNQGKILMQWATCEGYLEELELFKSYPPTNPNNLDTMVTLNLTLNEFRTFQGKKLESINTKWNNYDMMFVVYYVKYFKGMSQDALRRVQKYISAHSDKKIVFVKVSCDVMDFWKTEVEMNVSVD